MRKDKAYGNIPLNLLQALTFQFACHTATTFLYLSSFMRGIITTYTCACLFHPHPWEGNTNACTHFILVPGSCQTVPAIYVKFNALLCHTHTYTASTLKYVCIWIHMQIISVIHIRDALSKMKHQWKCQARNKHSNKDNSKDKQFPRFQMCFTVRRLPTHVLYTNFIMHTTSTRIQTQKHTSTREGIAYQMPTYVTVQAFCATACATLSHKSEL